MMSRHFFEKAVTKDGPPLQREDVAKNESTSNDKTPSPKTGHHTSRGRRQGRADIEQRKAIAKDGLLHQTAANHSCKRRRKFDSSVFTLQVAIA